MGAIVLQIAGKITKNVLKLKKIAVIPYMESLKFFVQWNAFGKIE